MSIFTPFIRRREPDYPAGNIPTTREQGTEPRSGVAGIPEPVRDADFEGVNGRRPAQLFSTFAAYAGFGSALGTESFGGRIFQPDPYASVPYGDMAVDAPRRVVARPPTRTSGG